MKLQYWLIIVWLWVELMVLGVASLGALMLLSPFQSQAAIWIAVALYITLALLVLVTVRYRLRRSPRWIASNCPVCGGLLYRSHRRPVSQIISLFVPLRRYYCVNPQCRWHGLRLKPLNNNRKPPIAPLSKHR